MLKKLLLFLLYVLILLVGRALNAQNCGGPYITDDCGELTAVGGLASGSQTIFCEGQDVIFVNNSMGIDSTIYCWGDGTVTRVAGAQNASHRYDFPEDTCIANNRLINLEITMIVIKRCGGEKVSSHSITTPVAIKVKPKADFDLAGPLCIDGELRLVNTSCPNDNNPSYFWTFEHVETGEKITSTDVQPSQRFAKPGEYLITLAATNQCGTDVETKMVRIGSPPTAKASVELSSSPAAGCLPLTARFKNESTGANTFHWSVVPDRGYSYLNGTNQLSTEPVFYFTEARTYKVILETENQCGKSTWEQMIEVIAKPKINLQKPPNGCENLTYSPSVSYSGKITSYRWTFEGGTPATSTERNPTNIYFDRPGQYKVTVVAEGPCGRDSTSRTVTVLKRETIVIEPVTPVCNTSDTFSLKPNFTGGTWFNSVAVTAQGVFDPKIADIGMNRLRYTYGPAGCTSEGSIDIEVKTGTPLQIGDATDICVDGDSLQLDFSPKGGTWSGNGIIDSVQGIFDPALAGAGLSNLKYTYREPTAGCITTGNQQITVVPLPTLTVLDSVAICLTNQNLNLNNLFATDYNPVNGTFLWQGVGVDTIRSTFNALQAGGVGAYTLTASYQIPPGCSVSKEVQVRVNPLVQALATKDTSVCQNSGTFQLQGLPSGGRWSGPGIDAQSGIINLSQVSPGINAYTYTIEANTTCESKAVTKVEVIRSGAVNAGTDVYVCASETSIDLPYTNPSNGFWSGPAPIIGNQVQIDSLTPGDYRFRYTIPTLPGGCNFDEINLSILPIPQASFVTDSIGCKDSDIRFYNQSTNAQRFAWRFGNGSTSDALSPTHLFNTAGDFLVTLEAIVLHPITNQKICSTTASEKITIIEPPAVVDFRMDQSVGCADLTVNFDNLSFGQFLKYNWRFGNFKTSEEKDPDAVTFTQGIEDTTYQITLMVANGCGDLSVTKSITVFPKPVADFGITFEQPCSGDTLLLNNTTTGFPRDFRWFFSNGRTFNTENPPPIVPFTDTMPSNLEVLLVATNECGVDSIQKTITVNPTDVRAFFNVEKNKLCLSDTLKMTNFSTPHAPFRWTVSDGSTYVTNKVNHVFRNPGDYKVVLYAEGCGFDSMTTRIEVLPLPNLAMEFAPAACEEKSIDFHVLTNAPGNLLHFGDGDSTYLKNSIHAYPNPGIYTVSATATSSNGCSQTIFDKIEIVEKPKAAILLSDSICVGATATFESVSLGSQACRWYFGDGEMSDGCFATHTFDSSGIFKVQLLAVSDMGCVDTAQHVIFVRPTPTADFAYKMLDPCASASVVFSDSSKGASSYLWDFGDGFTSADLNPIHTYKKSGVYEVRLMVRNDQICQNEMTQWVTVFEPPFINTEIEETCTEAEGSHLTINTNAGSFVTLMGENYNEEGTLHKGLRAGVYNILVETPQGCRVTDTVLVLRPQELKIGLTQDTFLIELGDSVHLDLQYNQPDVSIEWFPGEWLSDVTSANPTARPMHTKAYIATVTNAKGCEKMDTAFVEVQVRRDIFMPNTFTPDGNGINDRFRVRSSNPAVVNVKVFEVYDRWGKLLFRQEGFPPNDLKYGWDGNAQNGTPVQPGVYTYFALVQYVDKVEQLWEGKVLLIR